MTTRDALRVTTACALVALVASGSRAAEFGVPPAGGGDPAGYLLLVSPDAGSTALSDAFGDVAHQMTFYIEVDTRGLDVFIYDPGLYSPTGPPGQLDVNLDPAGGVGLMRYILYAPDWTVLVDTSFGSDTPATEGSLDLLYTDRRAPPGLYVLDCIYQDEAGLEQDISVFGLSVPSRNVYTLNLTTGHANLGGATIAEPVSAYPYLVTPSAGSDALGPVCGVSFHSYDLNAALNGEEPPDTFVTSQQLYTFPAGAFPPSADAHFWKTDMGGIPAGLLDSDDHGIYQWEFESLSSVEETLADNVDPIDVNVFSIQVLDYGVADRDFFNWPVLPPVLDDNPRRLYLPSDGGLAPEKEYMGHRASIVSGFDPITEFETTTVEVTLSIRNPNPYPLTIVAGTTYVVPDPEVSEPFAVSGTGVTAVVDTVNPRQINLSGIIATTATADVVYQVTLDPTTPGRRYLTGDGSDFLAFPAPTMIDYTTPYTRASDPPQQLGPICQIEYEIVPHPCVSVAALDATATVVCPGTDVVLDSAGSSVAYCPGGSVIYQWLVNGVVFDSFPAPDSVVVTPYLDGTYTLEVMCSTDPTCIESVDVVITTHAEVLVDAGGDLSVCTGDSVDLAVAVTGGTPPYTAYSWTTDPTGQPGDGATLPDITVSPTLTTTYTFEANDSLDCTGADSLIVSVTSDSVPGPVGNSLKMTQLDLDDLAIMWQDIVAPIGEYQLVSLDCDSDLDGLCDVPPTSTTLAAQPFVSEVPGVERIVELGGVRTPSHLVYYRVRATSECTLLQGPV